MRWSRGPLRDIIKQKQMIKDSLDRVIQKLSDELDDLSLPEDQDRAIALARDIDALRLSKFILKFYDDDL